MGGRWWLYVCALPLYTQYIYNTLYSYSSTLLYFTLPLLFLFFYSLLLSLSSPVHTSARLLDNPSIRFIWDPSKSPFISINPINPVNHHPRHSFTFEAELHSLRVQLFAELLCISCIIPCCGMEKRRPVVIHLAVPAVPVVPAEMRE